MPILRAGDVRVEVAIGPQLHRRLKARCDKLHVPIRHLVVDALTERLDFLDEKDRREEEHARAEREARGARFGGFRRMRGTTPAPLPDVRPLAKRPATAQAVVPATPPAAASPLPIEYAQCADKIYAAGKTGSPMERRLVLIESVALIKKKTPLTHPVDAEITATLNKLVEEIQARETASIRQDVPEVVIDVSKIRTFGNVGPDEGAGDGQEDR